MRNNNLELFRLLELVPESVGGLLQVGALLVEVFVVRLQFAHALQLPLEGLVLTLHLADLLLARLLVVFELLQLLGERLQLTRLLLQLPVDGRAKVCCKYFVKRS